MANIDFEKLDNAVVLIERFDIDDEPIGHGSGFFIEENGILITNYHVVEGAYRLKINIDINGQKKVYDVEAIISGDESKDIAKIKLKNKENETFPALKIAKKEPKKGEDCWTIGTPVKMKYMNSITEGIISNIYPEGIAGWAGKMLQVSAPYTHGSSGGALINAKGEVIGITCGGNDDELGARANINFAIWVGEFKDLIPIEKETVFDIADHYNRIINRNLGRNDLNNFQKVLDYYQKCLEIRIELFGGEDNIASEIHENIGLAQFELKNYDTALLNLNKCVEIKKNIQSVNSLSEVFLEIGGGIAFKIAECYVALQDKETAFNYFTHCANTRKERLGEDDQRTKDAVFLVKKLGSELNKLKDIPEWMNEKSFQEKHKEKLNKLKN